MSRSTTHARILLCRDSENSPSYYDFGAEYRISELNSLTVYITAHTKDDEYKSSVGYGSVMGLESNLSTLSVGAGLVGPFILYPTDILTLAVFANKDGTPVRLDVLVISESS